MKLKSLPQEGLKLIACMTMLLDHIGATVLLDLIAIQTDQGRARAMIDLYYALRCVGRLAFPLYCFLLAEGVRWTRNLRGYGLRLAIGALLTELPYDLLFHGGIDWAGNSAMVTLLLGFLYGASGKKLPKFWQRILWAAPFMLAAEALGGNYGAEGIGIIALFLLTEELPCHRILQTLGLAFFCWQIGGIHLPGFGVPVQMFGVLAMLPICLYSGRKLTRAVWMQWAFYLFYPGHLLVLWLLTL